MCTAAFASTSDNQTGPIFNDKQEEQYQQLKHNTSNFFGSVNKPFSIPNFLYGEPLFTPQHNEEQYEVIINRFFQTYPDLFQTTVNDFRVEIEQPKDRNITQVHLFQKYQNVPVFGAEAIFTFNDQHELISYLGKYIPNIDVNVKPNSTPAAVKQIVAQDLHIDVILQEPRLFIFNKGVFTNTKENTQLVWRLGTNGWVYFVNANTKAILYKYNDENSALSREVYTASGGTPSLPGTLVASEGVVISTISDDDVVEAYTYSEYVYNYFLDHFALDSYDGTGAQMVSTVDYDTAAGGAWCNSADDEDAAICPSTSQTIFADDMTTVDFVGHEWAHAVASYAVLDEDTDSYGLTHSDESGALSESYSDIFGVLIEAEYGNGLDWDFAEDSALGAVRNLEDPTIYGDPDVYSDYVSGGDTHDNAGIPNKAAYLIMREPSEGIETFNSTDVTGIGLEKAENIFYYALRDELIISATFDDNFNALLQTCLTLEVITIDTADCESIFDAYTAIGVNTASSYIEASVIASTETGYAPLTVDFDGSDSLALNATITDYVWDLDSTIDSDGDGSTTNDTDNTGPIASYTYANAGTFQARLTITDDTGNYTHTTTTITVQEPIEASFMITGDRTTAPTAVSFDASGTTDHTGIITDYSWNFGDGTTVSSGTIAATTHTYNPGSYTVTLSITDDSGYTATSTEDIMLYAGGNITSDTTWSADYDPYIVDGDLTIDSGYTLTIGPGVVIKFYDSTSYLTVNGTLNAQGTVTDGIAFTSYKDDDNGGDTNGDGTTTTPAAGDWQQIDCASGSIATLDYVTIQYGGQYSGYPSIYPMVKIQSDNVTVNYSTITDNSYYGIHIYNSSPNILNSTLSGTGSGWAAVLIEGGSATVEGNTISENDRGLYIYGGSPTVVNNTISNNSRYNVIVDGGSPSLSNNTMSNSYYGVYIVDGSPTLNENTVSNNSDYGVVIVDGSSSLNNNSISGSSDYGVVISGGSSTLEENAISGSVYGIIIFGGSLTLEGNTISDNSYYGLYNSSTTTTVTAENNWWGDASGPYNATSNPTGTGDTVSSYVDFDPWLTADPTADTTPPSDVTLGTVQKDVWAQTITLNWTNPTDSDFDHVQIDRTDVLAGTTSTLSSSETGTSYSDTTPSYNTTYTYTLYTVDTTGNVSTGVTTANQRLRNPAPTNLTLTAGDTTIAATWTASSAPASTIGGYIVYYGTSRTALTNSVDVGNVTNTTLTGLTNYTRYFVVITAYSKGGHESSQSGIRATRPHP